VLLRTFAVTAQPMVVTEHDWTFRAGNGRCGIVQSNIAPGSSDRLTTVYCGGPLFTVSMRAEVLLVLVLVPLGALCAVLLMARPEGWEDGFPEGINLRSTALGDISTRTGRGGR